MSANFVIRKLGVKKNPNNDDIDVVDENDDVWAQRFRTHSKLI